MGPYFQYSSSTSCWVHCSVGLAHTLVKALEMSLPEKFPKRRIEVIFFIYYYVQKSSNIYESTSNSDVKKLKSTTTYKKEGCNSGAKGKIFTFIATLHSYIWLCTVAES